jgi:NAD(P)-dependent dehydrogenase (short-subunit alcohol dehydrogenase family)
MLKEEDIERMVKETVGRWGRVDYAVNSAGLFLLLPPKISLFSLFGQWREMGLMQK